MLWWWQLEERRSFVLMVWVGCSRWTLSTKPNEMNSSVLTNSLTTTVHVNMWPPYITCTSIMMRNVHVFSTRSWQMKLTSKVWPNLGLVSLKYCSLKAFTLNGMIWIKTSGDILTWKHECRYLKVDRGEMHEIESLINSSFTACNLSHKWTTCCHVHWL